MNLPQTDRLYNLLPAIYRQRDYQEQSQVLRALMAVIEQEFHNLETNIDDLYDDWFIETCDEWVVPYIGDLVGAEPLYARSTADEGSQSYGNQERRAYVANVLAYRRRKGTTPVLEQLVRDVTGWRARTIEFFDRLALSQNLDHVRPHNTTVNLRSATLKQVGTPFEQQVAYTAEVRRIASQRGQYGAPNVGLFIWRLQSYPISRGEAYLIKDKKEVLQGRLYTFNPLGLSVPLFNLPQPETEITQLADEVNVPGLLPLHPDYVGYSSNPAVLNVFLNGQPRPVPASEVLITSLEKPEVVLQQYSTSSLIQDKVVAVDPELGKILALDRDRPTRVDVNYAYGFSDDVGGGSYDRSNFVPALPEASSFFSPLFWQIEQERSAVANPLAEAVQTWNRTVKAWQSCDDLLYLPLAQIEIPKVKVSRLQPDAFTPQLPTFVAGIASGFKVVACEGSGEVIVTPGVAIDAQGRVITLNQNYLLDLRKEVKQKQWQPVAERSVLLVLSYAAQTDRNWRIQLMTNAEIDQTPNSGDLKLASLVIDQTGNVLRQTDAKVIQPRFQPGIVAGFTVITPAETLEAIVTPGTAVDSRGRVITLDRNIAKDLRSYQDQTVWLTVSYRKKPNGTKWDVQVVRESEIDRYPSDTHFRLARLYVPLVKSELKLIPRPVFTPGVVVGLGVIPEGDRMVSIAPGRAVDGAGHALDLEEPYRITPLPCQRSQTLTVVIAYRPGCNRQITLLTPEQVEDTENFPPDRFVHLARFSVGATGKITSPITDLRSSFHPGIVRGLQVEPTPEAAQVNVTEGLAVDRLGNATLLQPSCQLDFSRYPGQNLIIFIAHQPKQSWRPLDVITQTRVKGDRNLGAVPVKPKMDQSEPNQPGVILIRDNRTYEGDLAIIIPTDQELQITAASGYRPHIRGNISVQGVPVPQYATEPNETIYELGELNLNGVLIEGCLTVQPGDLKYLSLIHCTIVPQPGCSIVAEATQLSSGTINSETESEDDEAWTILALIFYCFHVMETLVQLSFSEQNLSPRQRLQQLTRFALEEAGRVKATLMQIFEQWQCSALCPEVNDSFLNPSFLQTNGNNLELTIELDRSICGSIQLADSIPDLLIYNSILDASQTTSGGVIVAPGTSAEIHTSTLLGSTKVRSIEASDSLFDQRVTVLDSQVGCMRFCYVPDASQTPRRYRCQPDLALIEDLPELPPAMTAVVIDPLNRRAYAGSDGNGISSMTLDTPEPVNQQSKWELVNHGLTDLHVTTLTFFSSQENISYIFAGTASGKVVYRTEDQSTNTDQSWRSIPINGIHTPVNTLLVYRSISQAANAAESPEILLVGTAGNGLARLVREENDWKVEPLKLKSEKQNSNSAKFSLENQNITALAVSPEGHIFAGTDRGIFCYIPSEQRWQAKNRGLTDRKITALAIDPNGQLFAATEVAGVFRSTNLGDRWVAANTGLPNTKITALQLRSITGEITSQDQMVRGNATQFNQIPATKTATLTVGEQTRVIQAIQSNTELVIDRAFCPNLTEPKTFVTNVLYASTAGSGIFRSDDNGKTWNPIFKGGTYRNITAIAIDVSIPILLATTASGGLLYSIDDGARWTSLNTGLKNVDKKLLVLTRLHPAYTSSQYGQPGYAQLAQTCAIELRTGAEDGSEMGVFNELKQPQKEANLRTLVDEYLRFGLQAGIFYVT